MYPSGIQGDRARTDPRQYPRSSIRKTPSRFEKAAQAEISNEVEEQQRDNKSNNKTVRFETAQKVQEIW